jgi:hypothetical protein
MFWRGRHVQRGTDPGDGYSHCCRDTITVTLSQLHCRSHFYSDTIMQLHGRLDDRFNVARILGKLAPLLDPAVADHTVRPCILELSEDEDGDVRFFAGQALLACENKGIP